MVKILKASSPAHIMSVILTVLSAVLGLFASGGFGMWMMMELGVCSFCGVLAFTEPAKGEAVGKYFVVGSVSGGVLLCAMVGYWSIGGLVEEILAWVILVSLLMKLGLPPFHFWVVGALRGCTWVSVFLLLTIQKVLPLIFLGSSVELGLGLLIICFISGVAAGVGGLGYCEPYYLLGFGSMVVSSWFMLVSTVDLEALLGCLMIYSITFFILLACLQVGKSQNWYGEYGFWAMLVFVLMAGLPNGPVFMMKVWIYQVMLACGCVVGAWGVAFTSVLLIPMYMRMVTMAVFGVWGKGLNEGFFSGHLMISFALSFLLFLYSGVGWCLFL